MKKLAALLAVTLMALVLAGCGPKAQAAKPGEQGVAMATPSGAPGDGRMMLVGKTKVTIDSAEVYDPSKIEFAAMDGEPSRNKMFKPSDPEGIKENIYPDFDAKTFKVLAITAGGKPIAQRYYMFEKDGGALNKAAKSTGYKFATVYDSGDNKILPNLYTGYYDFAWTQASHLPENWSGYESRQQELWKAGDNYVIIGASYNDENVLYAPASVTSLKQLAGKRVGIMNPTYGLEATLNGMLKKEGLATESGGGDVAVEMNSPAPILNGLTSGKFSAAFIRSSYKEDMEKGGFHELATTGGEWGGRIPQVVLVVRKDILEKHPEIVQMVVQANYDATKRAKSDGEWAEKETEKVLEFRSEYERAGKTNSRPPKPEQLDAEANPVALRGWYDFMKAAGFFKTPYSFESLVDGSFYANVKK